MFAVCVSLYNMRLTALLCCNENENYVATEVMMKRTYEEPRFKQKQAKGSGILLGRISDKTPSFSKRNSTATTISTIHLSLKC
jgi:hypothetical protein